MNFINSLVLQQIEQGTYKAAYSMAGTIGLILLCVVSLWYIWRMRLNILKALPIAYIGYWFATSVNGFILFASSGFTEGTRSNLAVVFVYLLPLAWLLGKVFRMPWQTISEMITFGILAFHIPGRSGCIFTGCCYGYPCEWGLYSLDADRYVFPVVIVESLMTLGILAFLLLRTRGKAYVPDGKTMPWMLLLYGVGRFITEFFRDNDKLWLGCSDIAFHALFMAVVGGAILLLMAYRRKVFANAKH